jgi:hypothetical protein
MVIFTGCIDLSRRLYVQDRTRALIQCSTVALFPKIKITRYDASQSSTFNTEVVSKA